MAKINLLPWREKRRAQIQKQFNAMLGLSLVAGIVLGALIYLYYSGQVNGQMLRNDLLRSEIAAVDIKIKEIEILDKRKEALLARQRIIQDLQGRRYEMVSLFTELAKTVADGAQITSIEQTGDAVVIQGRAQSNARVSSYMKNIMRSPVISAPELTIIEARGSDRSLPYEFILKAQIKKSSANSQDDGTGVIEAEAQ